MRKKSFFILLAIGNMLTIEAQENKQNMNPFFQPYSTPYEVPPFDKIKNEHFKPAILEGIKRHEAEINAIANNTAAPTFENTILAMENAGELLANVNIVFSNLNGANTNEEMQKIAKEVSPNLAAHSDNIYLNEKLFARVKAIWDKKESLGLNPEQAKILENLHKAFVRSGANLATVDKEKLRKINAELSMTSLKYGQNILAETNKYELVITDKKDLAGLPQELINTAADDAKAKGKEGKWVFTLSNSSVMPFLQYSSNRKLRQEIWNAYQTRGNHDDALDNKENAIKLANLRGEKARLLGYKSHAAYVLEESMAKNPENVAKLLNDLWTPALAIAKTEASDIQKMMDKDGVKDKVKPYDWRYYTEKIRKQRFDLDEQELKPYFSLDNTRNGIFQVTEKLYGLKFKQLNDVPKYHDEVTVWEVTEADGTHVGILYMDFFPRASKRGGAWMTSYRSQKTVDGQRKAPVISIVCNFTKPSGDTPALLTFDEVTTFFHEFGHALHGLLSNVTYKSLAGTSVPRDFVELPSQIMENWAAEPEVLKMYAKHYKTGEVIPDALIQKLQKSGTFDQGFATVEYLAASFLDMDYHTQTAAIQLDANSFEKNSMKKIGLIDAIIPRYRSTYFSHIFSGGYSSGYYSYIWSGVLDTDAFEAFKTTNLFNPEKAKLFRKNVLEKGGTEDPMVLYKRFRGAEPSVEPLLRKRGLDKKEEPAKKIRG
ncbi:MAG: M3 family metallopeptidase [Flavobacterium sp.]|jgi:peptidyl-dipeptidase Dcp|uniref:M3 family metallopeptidase n=1 Tax=Flavobacterium sp. Leaf359 TaxID=1736351 RepID=UPI0006FD711E|nr:M3 family metallopeptidase [Flavobacterium sp. Leaf359]KQS46531.1 peptidase M3 [Flavobacterium sp. Leaf359]MBU7570637.1 M3 family metallopeptidase [Flavobacterium sp.]PZO32270.1 MAG: M3 family peptidase [Flavobacteriaceae bacterium]